MSVSIQERASRYISRMDAAVAGSGGHDATFAVACALVHGFICWKERLKEEG
jgi:hypothetical protein